VVRQLLQISLLFGIMVLKHMFTTALDKTIWLLENNVSLPFLQNSLCYHIY
jgi:hypothetical protein